jgi:glycosyltransferase involved in cell wall biosynthesis
MSLVPLVSIGIASYNHAAYLEPLLESIRLQTYPAIQLVLVDDCSTDSSVATATDWANRTGYHIEIHRNSENQGLVRVVSELRKRFRGGYVKWIGSDDWLLPNMVHDSVSEFERRGARCGAVYSDSLIVNGRGMRGAETFLSHFNSRFGPNFPEGNIRVALLSGFYVPVVTTLLRREALEMIGEHDHTLSSEDLDIWLRLSEHWDFAYLPSVTAAYRLHEQSMRVTHRTELNETFLAIFRKTNFAPGQERAAALRMLADHAEHYYFNKGSSAAPELMYTLTKTRRPKMLLFYLCARLGISYPVLMRSLRRSLRRRLT